MQNPYQGIAEARNGQPVRMSHEPPRRIQQEVAPGLRTEHIVGGPGALRARDRGARARLRDAADLEDRRLVEGNRRVISE